MKRLTAVLLSLIFVVAIGATAFAAFDTSRIDQYFETETQKRIDSMLELVLGKEKAEELVETSRTSSYDFTQTSVYKGYKRDKIEMRGDRAEISDFPLYLNTVAGGLDRRDQTIGGFSFVVKIYAVPVVEIIG